jgi:hypothetical protein
MNAEKRRVYGKHHPIPGAFLFFENIQNEPCIVFVFDFPG